jgi:hypothetical protein
MEGSSVEFPDREGAPWRAKPRRKGFGDWIGLDDWGGGGGESGERRHGKPARLQLAPFFLPTPRANNYDVPLFHFPFLFRNILHLFFSFLLAAAYPCKDIFFFSCFFGIYASNDIAMKY